MKTKKTTTNTSRVIKGVREVSYSETVNVSAEYCSASVSFGITLDVDGTPADYVKQRMIARSEVKRLVKKHLETGNTHDRLSAAVKIKRDIESQR